MMITPGAITSQAYDGQVKINNAIEKDIIDIAVAKPCACIGAQDYAPVYLPSVNK
jgi:hypothetical protein